MPPQSSGRTPAERSAPIDPFFVFDYVPLDLPEELPSDGRSPAATSPDPPDQRLTTYWSVVRGCRGPQPLPSWVITDHGAVDTELGILKTGKEADVFLVERTAVDGRGTIMAAKRYRSAQHSDFHRSSTYTEGRRTRRSRDARALERKSSYGRAVAAAMWANAEWEALRTYWSAGLPVPYPVQIDGTEILMEFIGDGVSAAPRLAQLRPGRAELEDYFEQVRAAMVGFAEQGVAHGDLSPYNLLVHHGRVVVIDLPQVVDLVANPRALELLHRDSTNVCRWFTAHGLVVDADALTDTLAVYAR